MSSSRNPEVMANSRVTSPKVYNGFSQKIRKPMLSRRSLLKGSLLGSASLLNSAGVAWPSSLRTQQKDASRNGKLLGTLDFVGESPVPLDIPQGSELDGRLYSDLSTLEPENPITLMEKFYIRSRASELLPDPATWQVKLDGRPRFRNPEQGQSQIPSGARVDLRFRSVCHRVPNLHLRRELGILPRATRKGRSFSGDRAERPTIAEGSWRPG